MAKKTVKIDGRGIKVKANEKVMFGKKIKKVMKMPVRKKKA
ncbi:hypothetical protein LCGC14_2673910 [marine sediment metagenome]|uniref:Uncharacterized protein n=1 Tax=marine sediment metagenome TaxID=412755 RepID=A0A0F8ZN93_9ZZZZ